MSRMSRIGRPALGLLIFAGSLTLWIGLPPAWLWLASRVGDDAGSVYGVALVGGPVAMSLWGLGLGRLDRAYGRLGRDGEPSSVLTPSLVVSFVVALIVAAAWLVLGGAGSGQGSLGPFPG